MKISDHSIAFFSLFRFDHYEDANALEASVRELGLNEFPNVMKVFNPETQVVSVFERPQILDSDLNRIPILVEYSNDYGDCLYLSHK